ncbi:NmrA-like family domain-containing protein [Gaertneriomyces semiglobifer]|nr:NmrA-like family domain-containing protein [Gaertneriomyces semiglobifer]
MSGKPIVVICGATGLQGGSVVSALQSQCPNFALRGITRSVNSSASKALQSKGVEMVEATFDDPSSLVSAFKNAYAVFAITNFWDHAVMSTPEKEVTQGKNLADAAKTAGVKYFIWSSLDNVAKLSGGKYNNVHHFTNKAVVEDYITSIRLKAISVLPAFYASNLATMLGPQKEKDGTVIWSLPLRPETRVPVTDVESMTGPLVAGILKEPDVYVGKRIEASAPYITMSEVAETLTKVTGIPARYEYVPSEEWAKRLPYDATEIVQMLGWFEDFGYYNGRELSPLPAGVERKGWKEYLQRTGYKGPN